jgi:hypothetical protein
VKGRGWCRAAGCDAAAAIGKDRCNECEARHQRARQDVRDASARLGGAPQADLFTLPADSAAAMDALRRLPAVLAMPRAGSVGIDTSEGAADRQDGPATAPKINARALALLCRLARPERPGGVLTPGATCDELEVDLGLPHQTCSGLLWRLEGGAYVVKTATTRRTRSGSAARVYQLTDAGRAFVASRAGSGPDA